MSTYDLLLTGGHLIDPSQKIDGIKDVGFKDGRVVEVNDKLDQINAKVRSTKNLQNLISVTLG